MTLPPGVGRATVLASLRVVYERDGRADYPSIMAESGLSRATVHYHIHRLIASGLAEHDSRGALRPAKYRTPVFVPVLTAAQIRDRFGR